MSVTELKSELIRLLDEIDADQMEDLVSSVKAFLAQKKEENGVEEMSPEIVSTLEKSLAQAAQNQLLSNEQILKETKEWLTK